MLSEDPPNPIILEFIFNFTMVTSLPASGTQKQGWPWTIEELKHNSPEILPKEKKWPKITIVTPSYNQALFLEETIRSVLLQGYPNLEYIIMDGGSTDGSVEIIQKYSPFITSWVSEPDKGQSNALNRGFQKSNGEILAWLNSDDTFLPGTLNRIGNFFGDHPEIDVMYGNAILIDENSDTIGEVRSVPFNKQAYFFNTVPIPAQSAIFWRRDLFIKVGMVNESLQFSMDCELIAKFIDAGARFSFQRVMYGTYRVHDLSKTHGRGNELWIEKWGNADILESYAIPQFSLRQKAWYPVARIPFRLRQWGWLALQGDLPYLLSRLIVQSRRRLNIRNVARLFTTHG